MSALDLSLRLDLPHNVGSTSRENRLHHVLGKTITRRFNSRDALPRLQKHENDLKMARLNDVYHVTYDNDVRRLKVVDTLTPSRGFKFALTSVSCPERLGNNREVSLLGRKFPNLKISNKRTAMDVRFKRQKGFPSTSMPSMTLRDSDMTSLPPSSLTTRGHVKLKEVRGEGPQKGLPHFGGFKALDYSKSHDSLRRERDARSGRQKTLIHSTPIIKVKIECVDNVGLGEDGQVVISSRRKQKSYQKTDQTKQRKTSQTEGKTRSISSLSLVPGESGGATDPQVRHKTTQRKISLGKRSTTPDPGGRHSSLRRSVTPSASTQTLDSQRSRFTKPGQAFNLFRRSGRKVYLILCWFKSLSKKQDTTEQTLKSFLDLARELEDYAYQLEIQKRKGLTFDPSQFSANKEIRLSDEHKTILTTPSRGRTPEMIQKVLTVLQNLNSFSDYPLHMQQKFARVAWFQEVPAKRVILKQGHYAENFYFIIRGSAIVKQLSKDSITGNLVMRAVARMQNGQSFGEVALLHHTVRTATVESASHMDILIITRADFQRIFFNTPDGKDPDHISFCRHHVPFLQGFPVQHFMEIPGTCLFHYFRPGAVVVSDSKENDWIYIVRSGSCKVLKKLDAVSPTRPWSERKLDLRVKIPREGTAEPKPRIDTRLRTRCSRDDICNQYQHSDDDLSSYASDDFEEPEASPVLAEAQTETLPKCDDVTVSRARVTRFELPDTCSAPQIVTLTGGEVVEVSRESYKRKKKTPKSAPAPAKSPHVQEKMGKEAGYSKSKLFFLPEIKENYSTPGMPSSWEDFGQEDDNITLAEAMTIEGRSTKSAKTQAPSHSTVPTCFVQLRILRPRDAFGLEMIKFSDDKAYSHDTPTTSVTLVSNGCELIMLSRRLVERYATEETKKHIREKVRPFPSEETLQHNLQIEVNWDLFRKDTVGEFLDALRASKNLNKIV